MPDPEPLDKWSEYVAFIDSLVYDNILQTVGVSLGYIAEQMDSINQFAPLFESRLELLDPDIRFVPSLDCDDPKGFNRLLAALIEDITNMSGEIKRVRCDISAAGSADETTGKAEQLSYQQMIVSNKDMIYMRVEIMDGVNRVVQEAADFCRGFERYSYLWLDDREYSMELFLTYGRMLDADEIEVVASKENAGNGPPEQAPTIEAFRDQIDIYESLYTEIENIGPFQVFNAWFQVDVRPFRQAVLNIVRKWGNMFKSHLVERVTSTLSDLGTFIRQADEGLLQQVVEGDYARLVSVMAYLMNVKERTPTTDEMFEPMQETIDLLKYYDMDIPEEVHVLLQELPEQWENTKKIAITVKQQVAPLQATEVVAIRNRIAEFDAYILGFRDQFRHNAFFRYDTEQPYEELNRVNVLLVWCEEAMKKIQCSGGLFEVNVPEFKLLKQCRKEMRMLKVYY